MDKPLKLKMIKSTTWTKIGDNKRAHQAYKGDNKTTLKTTKTEAPIKSGWE